MKVLFGNIEHFVATEDILFSTNILHKAPEHRFF